MVQLWKVNGHTDPGVGDGRPRQSIMGTDYPSLLVT